MPTAQGDPMPPNHHHDNDELHDHDLGLSHDLPTLLNRRRALGLLSGAGLAAALAACSSDGPGTATTSSSGRRRRRNHGRCDRRPRSPRRPPARTRATARTA